MLLVPDETRERLRREHDLAPPRAVQDRLRDAGLRPTHQRLTIGAMLFGQAHRHFTADDLHHELEATGAPLSLATVYNTLNHFVDAGLLRKIGPGGGRSWFDTDSGDHNHFHIASEDRFVDIAPEEVAFRRLPAPPPGYLIVGVDVAIRLARNEAMPGDPQRSPEPAPARDR